MTAERIAWLVWGSICVAGALFSASLGMDTKRELWACERQLSSAVESEASCDIQLAVSEARFSDSSALAQAMAEVAAVPYDRNHANCFDHAKMLNDRLDEAGIISYVAVTPDRTGNGLGDHAYVLVAVESVKGEFAPVYPYLTGDYYPINEIIDR